MSNDDLLDRFERFPANLRIALVSCNVTQLFLELRIGNKSAERVGRLLAHNSSRIL